MPDVFLFQTAAKDSHQLPQKSISVSGHLIYFTEKKTLNSMELKNSPNLSVMTQDCCRRFPISKRYSDLIFNFNFSIFHMISFVL